MCRSMALNIRNAETEKLADGIYMLQGAGGNVIALPGPDGALMIDGGLAANANALREAVRASSTAFSAAAWLCSTPTIW